MNRKIIFGVLFLLLIPLVLAAISESPEDLENILEKELIISELIIEPIIEQIIEESPIEPIDEETNQTEIIENITEVETNATNEVITNETEIIINETIEGPTEEIGLRINETEEQEEPTEETVEKNIIVKIIDFFIESLRLIKGEVVSMRAKLVSTNDTPIPNKSLNFYSDLTFIDSAFTNEFGVAEINWNPSEIGNFTIYVKNDEFNLSLGKGVQVIALEEILNQTINQTFEINSLVQGQAEVGKPVEWVQNIQITNLDNETKEIEINSLAPEEAEISEVREKKEDKKIIVEESIIEEINAFEYPELDFENKESPKAKSLIFTDSLESNETKEYEIKYSTPAPEKIETEEIFEDGKVSKNITIQSDASVHYQNVLAYADISESKQEQIHLYWVVNGSKIDIVNDERYNVSFYDINNNSLIDKISWIVPQLSEQNFVLEIIEITYAEHLDSNKTFVSDITDYVIAKDNNWSERINNSEYVRVTFEQELDNSRDITVYARGNGSIEVYEYNQSEVLATFPLIASEGLYKIYLTELNETSPLGDNPGGLQDTFDLKIVGEYLEFDWIVDPVIGDSGNISFVDPTPDNASIQSATNVEINVSITANLSEVIYNWNGTNFTMYDDSLVLMYNFDNVSSLGESNSLVVDVSNGGNNGTVTGATWNATGKYGGAFEFDGDGDGITFPDIGITDGASGTGELTFSSWAKPNNIDSSGIDAIIYTEGEYYWLFYQKQGDWIIRGYDGGYNEATASGDAVPDVWQHVVGTYSSSTGLKIYVNGELKGSDTWTGTVYTITQTNTIGAKSSNWDYEFNGSLDEVRIWDRVLSPTEIYQQYVSNLKKIDPDSWELYVNQSLNATDVLNNGTYTYQAFATDDSSNSNSTELRTVTIGDTIPPTWENNKTNLTTSTTSGSFAYFNITLNDTNPDKYIFSWYNGTDWANDSAVSYTDGQEIEVTKNITISSGEINWTWYFNDTAGNSNQTDVWSVTIDTIPPTWENNKTNLTTSTTSGSNVYFNITLNDTNPDKYIFSWYNGTTWANDSAVSYTDGQEIEVTKNITISSGDINWTWYFNDTAGNSNQTDTWSVTIVDTSGPGPPVNFSSSTPNSGDIFVTQTYLPINVSFGGDNVTVYLYNSTKNLINSSVGTTSPYFINFTNLAGGIYYFNATTFNSTGSNSTETRNVMISANGNGSYVLNHTKITSGLSGFNPNGLDAMDYFGDAVANIGDLNGDGVQDLAVGAPYDENGDIEEGAIYILFMNTNGTVASNVKISDGLAGFYPDSLDQDDQFGWSIANIGDLDGDGIQDIAVGAYWDEPSGVMAEGAIYILFMNTNGSVASNVKISDGLAGFYPDGGFDWNDEFGTAVTSIGDLNGDGVQDLAVGARNDENAQDSEGAVYILFMNTNGSVASNVKISDGLAGFNPDGLGQDNHFGSAVANIGDLDGDGVQDIAVGAWKDNAVYILFMNTNGSVSSNVKIKDGLAGFYPDGLEGNDYFGTSITNIGDLNGDGVQDLVVGAQRDEANEDYDEGAIYILYMNINGSVESNIKISDGLAGFSPSGLTSSDRFGSSITNMGDLNGDGVQDLAVGAKYDENDEGGDSSEGAVYILFLGLVPDILTPSISFSAETIASGNYSQSYITVNVTANDNYLDTITIYLYNSSLSLINSTSSSTSPLFINFTSLSDGTYYLNATANDTTGNTNSTETRTIILETTLPIFNNITNQTIVNGTALAYQINATDVTSDISCFTVNDTINFQINCSGYLQNNTVLPVGLYNLNITVNDTFDNTASALMWVNVTPLSELAIYFSSPTPKSGDLLVMQNYLPINVLFGTDNVTVYLYNSTKGLINSSIGITSPYFVNFTNLTAGVYHFNATTSSNSTETRNILISPDGLGDYVSSDVKISDGLAGFSPDGLDSNDYFGTSITNIGDLDGDGVQDLAVGAYSDENSESSEGAIYILFMNTNGSVSSNVKISDGLSGFYPSGLGSSDRFGSAVANIGDLNGDGVQDLAVGAYSDGNAQDSEGAVYILFMNTNGSVASNVKISDGLAGFNPSGLDAYDRFGTAIANIGDLDGDGVQDLAVGAYNDETGETGEGAIYILFMNTNGSVASNVKIGDGIAGFYPSFLRKKDRFGTAIANMGDLDGDGIQDLAVGAYNDEYSKSSEGAIYILFMNADGTVKSNVKISDGLAGFNPDGLDRGDRFGTAITNMGDLDGDGIQDLAVGAGNDENLENSEGATYLLFMNTNGSVKNNTKISDGLGGFNPNDLESYDLFGYSITNMGDLDGDGVQDLAVGAYNDENSESGEGAVYILFLGPSSDTTAPLISFGDDTTASANLSQSTIISEIIATDQNLDAVIVYLYNSSGIVNTTITNASITLTYANLTDGIYYINATANDTSSNNASTSTRMIVLDTINPGVIAVAPVDGFNTTSSSYNFTFNATDATQLSCNLFYDKPGHLGNVSINTNSSVVSGINTILNYSSFENRTHTWFVNCTDAAGNSNVTTARTLTVDQVPPVLTITSPTNNSYLGNLVYIKTEITDSLVGMDSAWFFILNNSNSSQQLFNGTLNLTDSWDSIWNSSEYADVEWNVSFNLYANDTLGNVANINVSFFLDNVNPTIQLIAPPTFITYYNANFSLEIYVQDATLNYTYFNLTNLSGTQFQFNSSSYESAITFHNWSDEINITDLPNGNYNLTVYGEDTIGNSRLVSTIFIVDTIDTNITLNYPTANLKTNETSITFNWTVTDNLATSFTCNLSIDESVQKSDITCLNNSACTYVIQDFTWAEYTWNVTCLDNATNSFTTGRSFIPDWRDLDGDNFHDDIDNLLWYATNVTQEGITLLNITVNGDSNLTTFNDSKEVLFYDNLTLLMNFTHNFSSSILDLSNVTIRRNSNYTLINLSNQLQGNKTMYLEDNNFIEFCVKEMEINNISEMDEDCFGEAEYDFGECIGNSTGITIDGITCTDEGSRIRVDNLQYSAIRGGIDTILPDVVSISPSNLTLTNNASVNFSANLTDNNGLANATLYIYNSTGALVNSTFIEIIGAPIATTVSIIVNLIEGIYTWFWEVFDIASNMMTSYDASSGPAGNYTLEIDLTNATINFTSPTTSAGNYSQNYILANVTANDTNLDTITINLYNSSNYLINSTSNVTSPLFINFAGLSDGTYYLNATANDSAGNVNYTETRTIVLDTTIPTWENNKTNLTFNTSYEELFYFNITLNDTNPDKYIFSWYNGSTWANDSAENYTDGQEIQVIKNRTFMIGGEINWTWYFNDTFGNSNQTDVWNVTLEDLDIDADGLLNSIDPLWFNEPEVTTAGVTSLNITVSGNDTTGIYNGTHEILFYDNITLMMNFTHNFTQGVLDLRNFTINRTSTSIAVNITNPLQNNKTLYLENNDFASLCVKDEEISDIGEMNSGCDGRNETDFTSCLGGSFSSGGIDCVDNGTLISVSNLQYSALRGTPTVVTPDSPSTGGGGGAVPANKSCSDGIDNDLDGLIDYPADLGCSSIYDDDETNECNVDADCNIGSGEVCWVGKCTKLFDIKIIEYESPIASGNSFDFTYFMKGMAEINGDVTVNFWIEQDGKIVVSGSDVIYMGSFEEKTEISNMFLPSDVSPGTYTFFVQLVYGNYKPEAHRPIEIVAGDMPSMGPTCSFSLWKILVLITLVSIFLTTVFYFEKRNIKKYKISTLLPLAVLILLTWVSLFYCLNWPEIIVNAGRSLALWSKTNILPSLIANKYYILIVAIIIGVSIIIKKVGVRLNLEVGGTVSKTRTHGLIQHKTFRLFRSKGELQDITKFKNSMIHRKIRWGKCLEGRKRNRRLAIRGFFHHFGFFKTEGELHMIEINKQLEEAKKTRQKQLKIKKKQQRKLERNRHRRLAIRGFFHYFGLFKTEGEVRAIARAKGAKKAKITREERLVEEEKRQRKLLRKRNRRLAIRGFFHHFGFFKTESELRAIARAKSLEKSRKIKEKESREKNKEEERLREEEERKQRILGKESLKILHKRIENKEQKEKQRRELNKLISEKNKKIQEEEEKSENKIKGEGIKKELGVQEENSIRRKLNEFVINQKVKKITKKIKYYDYETEKPKGEKVKRKKLKKKKSKNKDGEKDLNKLVRSFK